jgi:hypothetical protein
LINLLKRSKTVTFDKIVLGGRRNCLLPVIVLKASFFLSFTLITINLIVVQPNCFFVKNRLAFRASLKDRIANETRLKSSARLVEEYNEREEEEEVKRQGRFGTDEPDSRPSSKDAIRRARFANVNDVLIENHGRSSVGVVKEMKSRQRVLDGVIRQTFTDLLSISLDTF